MNNEWFTFYTHVCKIPCIVAVSYPTPYMPASRFEPESGGDWEYEIRDRSGRKADWLQAKVDKDSAELDELIAEIEREIKWHDQP